MPDTQLGVVIGRPGRLLPSGQPIDSEGRAAGVDLNDPEVQVLLEAGELSLPNDLPDLSDDSSDEVVSASTIDALTRFVGDDENRARRVLDLEAAKGDKARSTLVESLTALANRQEASS